MISDLAPLFPYAGGKRRSLKYIHNYLKAVDVYVEPFFGAGAIYCYMANQYLAKRFVINDVRPDIIGIYRAIRDNPDAFFEEIKDLIAQYECGSPGQQEAMFYEYRDKINNAYNAAQYLFVRKADFGGITAVDKRGLYDGASGHARRPGVSVSISHDHFLSWHRVLNKTEIFCGDFQNIPTDYDNSIFFCDPPYYGSNVQYGSFDKHDQLRCLEWCKHLAKNKSRCIMLSNRDYRGFISKRVGDDVHICNYDITYSAGINVSNRESLFVWNMKSSTRDQKGTAT